MLVVVHPGSACGSADFNLGLIEGSRVRERLARTILGWTDEIVVVDNDLSDELETYAMLGLAIAKTRQTQECVSDQRMASAQRQARLHRPPWPDLAA